VTMCRWDVAWSAEDCEAKREFEHDCCELLISPFRSEQLPDGDSDVDDFVHSAFPDNAALEKHVSVESSNTLVASEQGHGRPLR